MNINLLKSRLLDLIPSASFVSRSPFKDLSLRIQSILDNDALTIERRVNQLECFFIDCLSYKKYKGHQSLVLFCLRVTLMHRGYSGDRLEKIALSLLLLLFKSSPAKGRNKRQSKGAWLSTLGQKFVENIWQVVMSTIEQPGALHDLLWQLIQKLSEMLLDCGSDDKQEFIEIFLKEIRRSSVLTSQFEHSIWASASIESLNQLKRVIPLLLKIREQENTMLSNRMFEGEMDGLTSEISYVDMTRPQLKLIKEILSDVTEKSGKESVRCVDTPVKDALVEELELHLKRAQYYSSVAIKLGEPCGFFVQQKLFEFGYQVEKIKEPVGIPSKLTNVSCEDDMSGGLVESYHQLVESQKMRQEEFRQSFLKAYCAIVAHSRDENSLDEVRVSASNLVDLGSPLGVFINNCIDVLSGSVDSYGWPSKLGELVNIVVPKYLRAHIANLWFTLAEYFENQTEDVDFYKQCVEECRDQATVVYGKIFDSTFIPDKELSVYQEKAHQHALVEHFIEEVLPQRFVQEDIDHEEQANRKEKLSRRYGILVEDNYPYGIAALATLVAQTHSFERTCAIEVLIAAYGESGGNPLKLCEQIKDKAHYLETFGTLYLNALSNNIMSDQIGEWRKYGLSDIDIVNKLLSYFRSLLNTSIVDDEMVLIPGGEELLVELDTFLLQATLKNMEAIRSDDTTNLFCYTRQHKGALPAFFGLLAWQERNISLMEHLAHLSIAEVCDEFEHSSHHSRQSLKLIPVSPAGGSSGSLLELEQVDHDAPWTSTQQALLSPKAVRSSIPVPIKKSSRAVSIPFKTKRHSENVSGRNTGEVVENANKPGSWGHRFLSKSFRRPRSNSMTFRGERSKGRASRTVDALSVSPRRNSMRVNISPRKTSSLKKRPQSVLSISSLTQSLPSSLGYLILALVNWERIKNNSDPSERLIKSFKENLEKARSSPIVGEREFITAMILHAYGDSRNDKYIPKALQRLWLGDEEFSEIQCAYEQFVASKGWGKVQVDDKFAYFLMGRMTFHLESALEGEMYPPAAWAYAEYSYFHRYDQLLGDTLSLQAFISKIIEYLTEAISVHGYHPCLYQYGQIARKHVHWFQETTVPDSILRIEATFLSSQRYIYFEPGQVRDIKQSMAIAKKLKIFAETVTQDTVEDNNGARIRRTLFEYLDERDLLAVSSLHSTFHHTAKDMLRCRYAKYPVLEPPILKELPDIEPFFFKYHRRHFFIQFVRDEMSQSIQLQIGSVEAETKKEVLDKLFYYFEQARSQYVYLNKVKLPDSALNISEREILITSMDIAILGLIKLAQAFVKQADINIQFSQIKAVYQFLCAVHVVDIAIVGWDVARKKLTEIAEDKEWLSKAKNIAMTVRLNSSAVTSHIGSRTDSLVGTPRLLSMAQIPSGPRVNTGNASPSEQEKSPPSGRRVFDVTKFN